MEAAIRDAPGSAALLDAAHVSGVVLVRIAAALTGVSRAELQRDMAPLMAHKLSPADLRALIERETASLVAQGLAAPRGQKIEATDAGMARATAFLGTKGPLPRLWDDVRDLRLVARALGLQGETPRRLKALARLEGLRAAIVLRAFNLKIKGAATPQRLRTALAAVALERAFGNRSKTGLDRKTLSAGQARKLAEGLLQRPRVCGTDSRLVAALAADHVGALQPELTALRTAVLRRFIERQGPGEDFPPPPRPVKATARKATIVQLPPPTGRPDLATFAGEVRRHATSQAEGWQGNRKAYISRVWRSIRQAQAGWGLSEIEFKCMLAEAHRAGATVLASADLKDNKNIKDIQESAVVYKNTVFHFVRVDS